mgnify:CR=1 FL=1
MADARVPQLLERGLRHFALGEIDHAVACWQEAVRLDPENRRAREYLELVAQTALPETTDAAPAQGGGAPPSDAELIPWNEEGEQPIPEGARRIDAWLNDTAAGGVSDLPPVEAGGLPWQEWLSEVGRTGELPWLEEEEEQGGATPSAAAAPAQDRSDTASAAPAQGTFDSASLDAPAAAAADPLLHASWSEALPEAPIDPWASNSVVEFGPEDVVSEPWTPGPGSTGWDFADGGGAVRLDGDAAGDALDLLGGREAAPVAVPAELAAMPTTPGQDKRAEADTLMQGARELFELGDFSGSLQLVQKALSLQPDHRDALAYLERNQDTLVQMYESKIGPLDSRPRVVLRPDEIVWLNLDHRAGFVLAQIDGTITVDDLYALSGLSRLDTAKILAELVEQGVIAS